MIASTVVGLVFWSLMGLIYVASSVGIKPIVAGVRRLLGWPMMV